MAYSLELETRLSNNGWMVKIRDKERVETPHVTIMKGSKVWRYSLRNDEFLDREPPPSGVPKDVMALIRANYAQLQQSWDQMYPENPIKSDP